VTLNLNLIKLQTLSIRVNRSQPQSGVENPRYRILQTPSQALDAPRRYNSVRWSERNSHFCQAHESVRGALSSSLHDTVNCDAVVVELLLLRFAPGSICKLWTCLGFVFAHPVQGCWAIKVAGAPVAADKPILFLWIVFFGWVCDDCGRERHVCVVFGRLEEKTHTHLEFFGNLVCSHS
jgi:hypothetical protein